MNKCDVCGNRYDKAFKIVMGDKSYTFDCFECAIHALAPKCDHCGCKIIGHGMEVDDKFYCCASCGAGEGAGEFKDRV